jgi:hypothetical protein
MIKFHHFFNWSLEESIELIDSPTLAIKQIWPLGLT